MAYTNVKLIKRANQAIESIAEKLSPHNFDIMAAKNIIDSTPTLLIKIATMTAGLEQVLELLPNNELIKHVTELRPEKRGAFLQYINPYIIQIELKKWLQGKRCTYDIKQLAYFIWAYREKYPSKDQSELPPALELFVDFVREYGETGTCLYRFFPGIMHSNMHNKLVENIHIMNCFDKQNSDSIKRCAQLIDEIVLVQLFGKNTTSRFRPDYVSAELSNTPYSQLLDSSPNQWLDLNKIYDNALTQNVNKLGQSFLADSLNIESNKPCDLLLRSPKPIQSKGKASYTPYSKDKTDISRYLQLLRSATASLKNPEFITYSLAVTGQQNAGKSTWTKNLFNLLTSDVRYMSGFNWKKSITASHPSDSLFKKPISDFKSEKEWYSNNSAAKPGGKDQVWFAFDVGIDGINIRFQIIDVCGEWLDDDAGDAVDGYMEKLCKSVDCIMVMHPTIPQVDPAPAQTQGYFGKIYNLLSKGGYPKSLWPDAALIISKFDSAYAPIDQQSVFSETEVKPDDMGGDLVAMNGISGRTSFASLIDDLTWPCCSADTLSNYGMNAANLKDAVCHDEMWLADDKPNRIIKSVLDKKDSVIIPTLDSFNAIAQNQASLFTDFPHLTLAITGKSESLIGAPNPLEKVHVHNTFLSFLRRAVADQPSILRRRHYWAKEDGL